MIRSLFGSIGAAILVASCAVLTVDVDVYKGPLANHAELQLAQIRVMAIGARPLLIQLRDYVERDWRGDRRNYASYRKWCEAKDQEPGFREPYVRDASILHCSDARVVNAILGLYLSLDDLREGNGANLDLVAHLEAGKALAMRCHEVGRVLVDIGPDKEFWTRLASSMSAPESLVEGAEAILGVSSDKRDIRAFVKTEDTLVRSLAEDSILMRDLGAYPSKSWLVGKIDVESRTGNGRFELARDPDLTRVFVRALIDDDAEQANPGSREWLARRIQTVGDAFLETRQLLDDGLTSALHFLGLVAVRKDLPNRDEAISATARIAALVTQPRYLAALLNEPDSTWTASDRDFLRQELPDVVATMGLSEKDWNDSRYAALTDRITEMLTRQPDRGSRALLAAHQRLKSLPDLKSDFELSDGPVRNLPPKAWQFGIARAYSFTERQRIDLDEILRRLQIAKNAVSTDFGFSEGRPERGLVSLIDDAIAQVIPTDPAAPSKHGASYPISDALVEALAEFAEKILFVVDNDSLLDRGAGAGDRLNYVRVLQATGNSILSITDELRQREEHRRKSEDAAEREGRSARAVWAGSAESVIDGLVRRIGASASVPDDWLRTEHDAVASIADNLKTKRARYALLRAACSHAALSQEAFTKPWTDKCSDKRVSTRERLDELSAYLRSKLDASSIDPKIAIVLDAIEEHRDEVADAPADSCAKAIQALATVLGQVVVDATPGSLQDACNLAWTTRSTIAADEETLRKKEKALAAAEQAARTGAAQVIAAVAPEVLVEAAKRQPPPSRAATIGLLVAAIEKKKTSDNDGFGRALFLVRAQPIDVPHAALSDDPTSGANVMDDLLASLRHAHVQETSLHGIQTGLARNLAEAIDLAETYRTSMIHIRPPSAYLRSSYPVTSLQDNRGTNWRNELHELLDRSTGGPAYSSERNAAARIQSEIDKQFWQNINRIRVSGFGNTNYVVAKDDIGNWYVKSYSGDPAPVIRGAQAMALAGLSGKLGTDSFDRLEAVRKARETGQPYAPGKYPTVLGKQIDRFEKRYDEAARKDSDELRTLATDAPADVKKAWKTHADWNAADVLGDGGASLLSEVDAAKTKFLDKVLAKPDPNKEFDASKDCLAILRAMLDCEDALLVALDVKALAPEPGSNASDQDKRLHERRVALIRALRADVHDVVGSRVANLLTRRQQAASDYESALEVLGQRAEPETPSEPPTPPTPPTTPPP